MYLSIQFEIASIQSMQKYTIYLMSIIVDVATNKKRLKNIVVPSVNLPATCKTEINMKSINEERLKRNEERLKRRLKRNEKL